MRAAALPLLRTVTIISTLRPGIAAPEGLAVMPVIAKSTVVGAGAGIDALVAVGAPHQSRNDTRRHDFKILRLGAFIADAHAVYAGGFAVPGPLKRLRLVISWGMGYGHRRVVDQHAGAGGLSVFRVGGNQRRGGCLDILD